MEKDVLVSGVLLLALSILELWYLIYQRHRCDAIMGIFYLWIIKQDPRYFDYTFEEMYNPTLKNWFGLKWPREKDFKLK